MEKRYLYKEKKIYFSCWSRKGYAIFVALGKNVCISAVSLHICECALLKSARKGIIVKEGEDVWINGMDKAVLEYECGIMILRGKVCPEANGNHFQNITTWKGYAA